MVDPGSLRPIYCRACGHRMEPATACSQCGWMDTIGFSRADAPPSAVLRRSNPTPNGAKVAGPRSSGSGPSPAPPPSNGDPATTRPVPSKAPTVPSRPPSPAPAASLAPPVGGHARMSVRASPSRTSPATSVSPAAQPLSGNAPSRAAAAPARPSRAVRGVRMAWKRYLPPVRLVWIFLGIIMWNGKGFLNWAVAEPLLLLPLVAVATDLGFQYVRFPRLRFPDAAIANGLFLSVILWPATESIPLVSVMVATVGLRHLLRVASHPLVNPAAAGVLVAATVFALPQPWHVGSTLQDAALVAALGVVLWSRTTHTWRILIPYFAVNAGASAGVAALLGGTGSLLLALQATVLSASTVFFGFFMVSEPRTAPSARSPMFWFGGVVGAAAALLPVAFAEATTISAVGVLSPYLALFVGNLMTAALPSARGIRRATPRPSPAAHTPALPRSSGGITPGVRPSPPPVGAFASGRDLLR